MKQLLMVLVCAVALLAEAPEHYVFTRSAASLRFLPGAGASAKDTAQVFVRVPEPFTGVVVRLSIGPKTVEGYGAAVRGWALVAFEVDLSAGAVGRLEMEMQKAEPAARVETPVVIPLR